MAERRRGLLSWLVGGATEPARGSDEVAPAEVASGSPLVPSADRLEDLGQIGRGAMASIRLVRDRNLLRQEAMKVLDPGVAQTPGEVERFIEEAQITGQLDHPNVPPVYEVGSDEDGTHFFLMKYVQGKTFEQTLGPKSFSVRDERQLFAALQVLLKACEALSFAHARGVLHCDLKPTNLMVGSHGQVYVMDWGIARLIRRGEGRTRAVQIGRGDKKPSDEGKVMGSLGYMAPEQAKGRNDELDERCDVFALGAMLYRVLTGRPPYQGHTLGEVLAAAAEARWMPPQDLVSGLALPSRLCAIAMKAMSRDPAGRHPTADALREELEAYLSGPGRVPTRTFALGQIIVREGEPGESAFAIVSGRCLAFKTEGSRRQVLREMGPGDVFGEMAVLTGQPRSATVEALEEVKVAVLGAGTLAQDLGQTAYTGPLLKALVARFRDVDQRATEQRRELEAGRVREAVMTYLAVHAETREGRRVARWLPLCQTLSVAFGMGREAARAAVVEQAQVAVDPERDEVCLGGPARPAEPSPAR